jgi:putative ABC transport system permease protein
VLGLALTFPVVKGFAKALPTFFPVINVAPLTIALGLGAALLAGLAAAAIPANRAARMPIVIGLRMAG